MSLSIPLDRAGFRFVLWFILYTLTNYEQVVNSTRNPFLPYDLNSKCVVTAANHSIRTCIGCRGKFKPSCTGLLYADIAAA